MSISAISASTPNPLPSQFAQPPYSTDFQKLTQDFQSGNLSAAQTDLSTLQQDLQGASGTGTGTGAGSAHHVHFNHILRSGGLGDSNDGSSGSTGSTNLNNIYAEPPILANGQFAEPLDEETDPISLLA